MAGQKLTVNILIIYDMIILLFTVFGTTVLRMPLAQVTKAINEKSASGRRTQKNLLAKSTLD